MSTTTPLLATPIAARTETGLVTNVIPTSSVSELVARLSTEVEAAAKRVHSFQVGAAERFVRREEALSRFSGVADRIESILLPRLEAFREMDVFSDTTQSVPSERRESAPNGFHDRRITLSIPHSDKRPVPMELSFVVGHDESFENIILEYRVQIIPIFLKFENNSRFAVPINQPNETAIAAWIGEMLVRFTRLYFEVFFHEEYQKAIMETDPVMNVRFPKAFAAAKREYQQQSYYFFTTESIARFDNDPSIYTGHPRASP